MLTTTTNFNSPVRSIKAKVEHKKGSTLLNTFTQNDRLQQIEIQRVAADGKFFGMVICQRMNVKLVDVHRELTVSANDTFSITIGDVLFPTFTVTEVNRDEKTNQLSITGYDAIDKSTALTVADLAITAPYTLNKFSQAIGTAIGAVGVRVVGAGDSFLTNYPTGANFEGTETVREALNALAEATQTIAFMDNANKLVFKRLSPTDKSVFTISRDLYIDLSSKTNRRLVGICSATELGDNVSKVLEESGTTQYVWNNPFWDLRADIDTLVNTAVAAVGKLTINQFDCSWIGNPAVELGDKITLITKDNEEVYSYILDDTITYDGALKERTQWEYQEQEETESNPTSIGDAIRKTYARVDKVNKEITLHVEDVQKTVEKKITTEVNSAKSELNGNIDSAKSELNGNIDSAKKDLEKADQQLQTQITTNTENIAELTVQAGEIAATVTETQETITETKKTLEGEISSQVGAAKDALGKDITALQNKDADLEKRVTQNTTDISSLTVKANSIETSVKETQTTITEYRDDLQEQITDNKTEAQNNADALQKAVDANNTELQGLKTENANSNNAMNKKIEEIQKEVATKTTPEQLQIAIKEAMSDGVTSVETETGFVFDKDGLSISKTGSEMTTLIDEDGMTVSRSNEAILTADSNGVDAINLTAHQYLIVGLHSRFQDYGTNRTGCFFIT